MNKMKAKELFEQIGYIVSDDLTKGSKAGIEGRMNDMHSISAVILEERNYDEEDEYIEDEDDIKFAKRIGKYRAKEIFFESSIFEPTITIRYKNVKVQVNDKTFNIEFNGLGVVGENASCGKFGIFMTPQELQAINKQIEELGWYDNSFK